MAKLNDYGREGDDWRLDDDGRLDDIVVNNVSLFRMERMNVNQWWIGLYSVEAPGEAVHIDIEITSEGMIATRRED